MKFVDPLATLQYMGGALPMHAILACYGAKSYYFDQKLTYSCDQYSKEEKISIEPPNYNDVLIITIVHVLSGVLRIVQKQFSKKNDRGAFLKTFCSLGCIIIYIPAILNIFVEQDNDRRRFPSDIYSRNDCPSVRRLFNFRMFEICVFFS